MALLLVSNSPPRLVGEDILYFGTPQVLDSLAEPRYRSEIGLQLRGGAQG